MDTNQSNNKLYNIFQVLLSNELHYKELFDTMDELFQLLQVASQMHANEDFEKEHIYLPSGKAIGAVWAGLCVKEIMRTRQFVRGIFKAVKTAQQRFPGTKLHILYAGTGPFATLVLPLTTIFSPNELEFTLIEINTKSIELLKNTITFFGIEKYVKEIVQADAALFQAVEKDEPIHIIISETMLNALQKEPQVAVTLNLLPQLVPNGIFIPQDIIIEAGLLSYPRRLLNMEGKIPMDECYKMLKTVFQLNKDILPLTNQGTSEYSFNKEVVEIPRQLIHEYPVLCLFTTILVFDDVYLTHWQSSLNQPQILLNLQNIELNKVSLQYRVNKTPGFLCTY